TALPASPRSIRPEPRPLHDALPIWCRERVPEHLWDQVRVEAEIADRHVTIIETRPPWDGQGDWTRFPVARLRYTVKTGNRVQSRSEEHTSELQSRFDLVCRLLLEKK